MTAYLVRRVLALIPVMAVVVTVVFLLIHLIPGDPVAVMLGPDATPSQIQATREALGLDRPLHEILGIELNFVTEELAPPVDERRLRAFIREELATEDRDEIITLIASFRSWYSAWGELLRRGAR